MTSEQSPVKPWTAQEIEMLIAQIPKSFHPKLFSDPVKKIKPNLDERPIHRRIKPQNLGIVIVASGNGQLLSLPETHREVVEARYLSEDGPASFKDLAKRFKKTRQRISQIEQEALEILQRPKY